MATPLSKDQPQMDIDDDAEITTADLAAGNSPAATRQARRSQPVSAEQHARSPMAGANESLFPGEELEGLRTRWQEIQTAFVDEPRKAVEQADGLVATAMKRLAEVFARERSGLEQQWDRGDRVSTEELRVALQRYRRFFERLLSV
jgi:hypothetical protein